MPVCVTECKIELGVKVSLIRGLPVITSGQAEIAPDSYSVGVERPQSVDCIKISSTGGKLTQGECLSPVFPNTFAVTVVHCRREQLFRSQIRTA